MTATRVALAGAFDVDNFGDLLFPLVAAHALRSRLRKVDLLVYGVADRPAYAGLPPVRAAERLPEELADVDLLLVGGGDIIRFDGHELIGHASGWVDFPELWLKPTLTAAERGVPVVWNAVGVPWRFRRRSHSTVAAALRCVDYPCCSRLPFGRAPPRRMGRRGTHGRSRHHLRDRRCAGCRAERWNVVSDGRICSGASVSLAATLAASDRNTLPRCAPVWSQRSRVARSRRHYTTGTERRVFAEKRSLRALGRLPSTSATSWPGHAL